MKTEVNPKETDRAEAFEMWMSSPMPMVTLTKAFDVSNLLKVARKSGVKFNALLCWCIGKAATQVKEFYLIMSRWMEGMAPCSLNCCRGKYETSNGIPRHR